MDPGLLQYPVRPLLALRQAIDGNDPFFHWLIQAGYPELAAFSHILLDDQKAEQFLLRTPHRWLGLLSHAIDGDPRARTWITLNLHQANLMFALACRKEKKAQAWLRSMNLHPLILLAQSVADLRNLQELDAIYPYKKKF